MSRTVNRELRLVEGLEPIVCAGPPDSVATLAHWQRDDAGVPVRYAPRRARSRRACPPAHTSNHDFGAQACAVQHAPAAFEMRHRQVGCLKRRP